MRPRRRPTESVIPAQAGTRASLNSNHASAAILSQDSGVRRMDPSSAPSPAGERKLSGYGLPCAKCHLYYPADIDICPTCHHPHRVSPTAPKIQPKTAQTAAATIPDVAKVEHEREEFLRQFKSQLLEAQAGVGNASDSLCKIGAQHPGDPAHAEICKICYERLQERVDVCEGALHLDLK